MMTIVLGLMMGLLYIAPPGPINAVTIDRGLRAGFRAALAVQVGALVGDVLYALAALAGGARLLAQPSVRAPLELGGALLLAALGCMSVRDAWRQARQSAAPGASNSGDTRGAGAAPRASGLATGAALSLFNPYTIAFWIAMGGGMARLSGDSRVTFLGGFIISLLLWAPCLSALASCRGVVRGGRLSCCIALANGVILISAAATLGLAAL